MDKEDTGIISRNKFKKEEKHPDFTGQGNYAGMMFKIAGWIKVRQDGSGKFLSLRFTDASEQTVRGNNPEDDEIPF